MHCWFSADSNPFAGKTKIVHAVKMKQKTSCAMKHIFPKKIFLEKLNPFWNPQSWKSLQRTDKRATKMLKWWRWRIIIWFFSWNNPAESRKIWNRTSCDVIWGRVKKTVCKFIKQYEFVIRSSMTDSTFWINSLSARIFSKKNFIML